MRTAAVVALLILVLDGCALERACTLIASLSGIAVTVEPGTKVDRLQLTICPDSGACREVAVQLDPADEPVDPTCVGSDPDDSCSASMSPNGSRVGFAEVPELGTGPVTVSARFHRDGQSVREPAVTVTPIGTEPNGPGCGGGAPQARVMIGPDGLRAG